MRKIEALKNLAVNLGLVDDVSEIESNDLGEVIGIMAAKVAPNQIVLKSSTADSVKKFKITVIDDGTISATEVTD